MIFVVGAFLPGIFEGFDLSTLVTTGHAKVVEDEEEAVPSVHSSEDPVDGVEEVLSDDKPASKVSMHGEAEVSETLG